VSSGMRERETQSKAGVGSWCVNAYLRRCEVPMKRQDWAGSDGAFKRAAFPVFRGWAAVACLGFGLFQLVAVLASPEHVDLGDAILGLQIWAALVALGGG